MKRPFVHVFGFALNLEARRSVQNRIDDRLHDTRAVREDHRFAKHDVFDRVRSGTEYRGSRGDRHFEPGGARQQDHSADAVIVNERRRRTPTGCDSNWVCGSGDGSRRPNIG